MQTEIIMALFSVLLLWMSGFALIYLVTRRPAGGLNVVGVALALPLGAALYSTLTILSSLIGIRKQLVFSYYAILVIDFLFFVFLMTTFILKVREFARYDEKLNPMGLLQKIRIKLTDITSIVNNKRSIVLLSLVIIGIVLMGLLFSAAIYWTRVVPITFWDSISAWSFKAKAFFIDGALDNFFNNYDYSFTHNSYPLAFSLLQSFIAVGTGEFSDVAVKMIFPFIYILFGVTASSALLRGKSLMKSVFIVIMTAFLLSTSVIFDHSYIEYPNLIFALCVVVCAAATFKFMHKPTLDNLSLATLATAMLPLFRNEGMIFFAFNIIFLLIVYFKNRSRAKVKVNSSSLVGFVLSFIFLGLWMAFSLKFRLGVWEWGGGVTTALQIVTTEPTFVFSLKTYIAEMLFSIKDSTGAFMGSGYGMMWVLIFWIFAIRLPDILKDKGRLYIFSSALVILIIYILGGAIVPDFLISADRYLLPVFGVSYSLLSSLLCELKLTG
ncbi:MAG: hypothetical protein M1371_00160 [Actinobacteria bacterium]|nr:hypothetical protein [Actinomycetota bacterium]